jgi:hypothetical protein
MEDTPPDYAGGWVRTHKLGAVAALPTHRLFGVLGKARHSVPRTRPSHLRVLEDASLGFDIWFIVQGARWNKDLLGISNSPWQGASAFSAESSREALRPG